MTNVQKGTDERSGGWLLRVAQLLYVQQHTHSSQSYTSALLVLRTPGAMMQLYWTGFDHARTVIRMTGASTQSRDEEVSGEGNVCNYRGRWLHPVTVGMPALIPGLLSGVLSGVKTPLPCRIQQ